MGWLEALILGLLQGLTEFLPVSSSGHLELGKYIMDLSSADSLQFTVLVHGATVLSTIVVFYKDILRLFGALFRFKWDADTQYIVKIIVSMIPVGIVGLFFKDYVESFFDGNIIFVGCMLLVTAMLLYFTYYAKTNDKEVGFKSAFIIGVSQAMAVLPGISRSGSTIATGLLLGVKREEMARFSFLMVLVPIIGANLKDLADMPIGEISFSASMPMVVGFITAFVSGLAACKLMINLVNRGKLVYFAIYCTIIGLVAIAVGLFAV